MSYLIYFAIYFVLISLLGWFVNRPKYKTLSDQTIQLSAIDSIEKGDFLYVNQNGQVCRNKTEQIFGIAIEVESPTTIKVDLLTFKKGI